MLISQPSGMEPPTVTEAGRRNLRLLVQLRWLAVGGQLATILGVHYGLGIRLPVAAMLAALGLLVVLNLLTLAIPKRWPITNLHLVASLIVDVTCLTIQLFLSGGATNPFASLYLLQVVLGAILLETWSSWALVALTSGLFAGLAVTHRPLPLPALIAHSPSPAYVLGSWFNFTLTAVLIVLFVTRVTRNLRERDSHLAELRQRAAEEEHIVRIGLLASGAAHELGTPLASLAVILSDWKNEPAIAGSPHLAAEVADMRAEVMRCKDIVSGVLFAAGEVTGEAPARTTLRRFVDLLLLAWSRIHPDLVAVDYGQVADWAIIADRALGQALTNTLDNAVEAGASRIALTVDREGADLVLRVEDDGHGFPDHILAHVGKPYQSSKLRPGSGLGLFLANNVLRTLGGTLRAVNLPGRGARITMRVPLTALAAEGEAA
ncbi:ATP-binding protein [Sphingomonas abaci]|uniref:histidine kinase n=1 Tax=Sphingomonas abaci TaxID=237611 RepID=A0A7W7ALA6_9SPHN|nr:ATP-binding protein [Sphingomonas abaci]MBB4618269.1 two-component system sensor histidine kinase RegB [Sphingomonas abaci]